MKWANMSFLPGKGAYFYSKRQKCDFKKVKEKQNKKRQNVLLQAKFSTPYASF